MSTSPLVLAWTPSPEWMDDGACADDPQPDRWFDKATTTEAKATCAWCVVRQTCRTYALENDIPKGVWGGLTEDERRELKARPARPRPGFTRGQAPAA